MADRLVFNVLHGPWTAGEHGTFVDEVTVDDPDPELVRFASHAHAAGVLQVTEGLDDGDVESQEDSEAKLAEAMGEHKVDDQPDGTRISYWTGPWQEGNALDYIATRQRLLDLHNDPDVDFALDPELQAQIETGIASAEKQLAYWRKVNGVTEEGKE